MGIDPHNFAAEIRTILLRIIAEDMGLYSPHEATHMIKLNSYGMPLERTKFYEEQNVSEPPYYEERVCLVS